VDGITDNTQAIQQAIAACAPGKAVFISPGTHLLSYTLQIKRSNICLTGKKKDPAVLYFSKGIENLYPLYNYTGNKKTIWS
jgi:polygalacturonase